jgi:hypothetical protein
MTTSELIAILQNYDPDTDVIGLKESREWTWDNKTRQSLEELSTSTGILTTAEPWSYKGVLAVRIS